MFLFMLPFLIAIGIFGSIAYKEIKNIMNLANNNTIVETKPENIVESAGYLLRDNATDLQREYFKELKEAIEGEEPADKATVAALVAKNYVADFYTWTNKSGQYDIGGFSFLFDGEFENGDHYKDNLYLQARDGFYKYLSTYATQYGKENLIEVENVEVVSCQKMSSPYVISQHIGYLQDENEEWYDYRENIPYEAYNVQLRWNYKEGTQLNLNQFANSVNLAVAEIEGSFYIVEASDTPINGRSLDDGTEVSDGYESDTVTESAVE
jgi:hypothetical protein